MLARDEVVDAAREWFTNAWGVTSFTIVSERTFHTWWRRTRMELIVDVGWEAALASVTVDAETCEVVVFEKVARAGHQLALIDEQTAVRIAKDFARRAEWSSWERVWTEHRGGRWYVKPQVKGMPEGVVLCDHTGVVLHPRPDEHYRPPPPDRAFREERPIRRRTALVLRAKEHCAKMYGETAFDVIAEESVYRWWGRREVTFTIDVGWERALVDYVMNEGNARVVRRDVRPRPGVALRPLTKEEAIAAATEYAHRFHIPLPAPLEGEHGGSTWYFRSHRPNICGASSWFLVCGTTGIVVERGFIQR